MSNADNFKCWFSDILVDLYNNDHAGFVTLMVTFPLLERYLREKSGVHERSLDHKFYSELRGVFPALSDNPTAVRFWEIYRHGLLHQVSLKQKNGKSLKVRGGCVTRYISQAIEIDLPSGDFSVHPEKFANTVIQTIEADFKTFEGQHSLHNALPDPGSGPTGATGPQ